MKRNRFASVCMSFAVAKPQKPKPRKLNTVDVDTDSESDNELYVATIETVNSLAFDEWSKTMHDNHVPEKFQLDTGEKCNIISLSTWKAVRPDSKIQKQEVPLRSYSGHLKKKGFTSITCRDRDQDFKVNFYIVKSEVQAVLEAKTCQEMRMLQRIHSLTPSDPLSEDIGKSYRHLFKILGCLPGMHSCTLVIQNQRPVAYASRA